MALNLTDWFGNKAIIVSEPRSKKRVISERSSILLRRGIIFVVSDELTEFQVASEIKAQDVRRMVKRNGSGNIVKTGSYTMEFKRRKERQAPYPCGLCGAETRCNAVDDDHGWRTRMMKQ